MIAGKNTNRLGVEEIAGPASETIPVTNLERTLIDIVVRPAYAGGTSQLLKAYPYGERSDIGRPARSHFKAARLRLPLPSAHRFSDAKGGLPQTAGLPNCATLGLDHDFYLAHGLQQPEYSRIGACSIQGP